MALRIVQAALALLGIVATTTGLVQVIGGSETIVGAGDVDESVESELRFLSAFWMALGLTSLWLAPRVLEHPLAVRGVLAALFAGGVARVISLIAVGAPDPALTFLMALELALPPLILAADAAARRG